MSEGYGGLTDEELIDRLRDGEAQITDYIMDKYKNLVRKKAKSMYILGADNDDLIQEGMIGLLRQYAIMTRGVMPVFIPLRICVFRVRCIMQCRHHAGKSMRRSTHTFRSTLI